MSRERLTDRFIASRKAALPGRRDDYQDAIVPGLTLRVTDTGHKSFVLIARYPGHPKNPTRRSLGPSGALSLEQARAKARTWLELIAKGIDPQVQEARQKAVAERQQANTFSVVATAFLDRHAIGLKKAKEARTLIQAEFVKRWGDRPITDITPEEVARAIRAIVDRGAFYQAHNAFGHLRRLYSWAMGTNEFGIQESPLERLKPADLIGKREARDRILDDSELRAVWDAAEVMGYPYGPVFKLLILTGQREREVADATWSEIDLAKRLWTIPSARTKGTRAQEVPLSPAVRALLEVLPRWKGDFVFSTTAGEKPINGFSKAKSKIDRLSGVSNWKIHDLRRTMRTHLSALPVQDLVRELVIGHARPGLHRVYDLHAYQNEKRRCLQLWERRLFSILEKPAGEVVPLRGIS